MKNDRKAAFLILSALLLLVSCVGQVGVQKYSDQQVYPINIKPEITVSFTPFQPNEQIVTVTPKSQPGEIIIDPQLNLWISQAVPKNLRNLMVLKDDTILVSSEMDSSFSLKPVQSDKGNTRWVYVLVAPFPTLVDDVSQEDLLRTWKGQPDNKFSGSSLYVSPETHAAFETIWGSASVPGVKEMPESEILDYAWSHRPSWALIPFEKLEPRWKVISIDGVSPLQQNFEELEYPLVIYYGLVDQHDQPNPVTNANIVTLPESNLDHEKMTSLLLTGVTALVRATGAKMEENGMTYPAVNIKPWMIDADFTHISNEVAFAPDCPPANPYQVGLRFCSRPEYFELIEDIDADVVELSGNHLLDWSEEALEFTLALFRQNNLPYYAGGENAEEARKPFLIEHHGNKIALIGCNPAGPEKVWATETKAGAANCEDYEWIKNEISRLREEGYLPVVTLQYNEHYAIKPTDFQKRDFPPLIDSGAVIVSGSQAHFPNGMEFSKDGFIHYGLGNLFFDQMDFLFPGVQREFLDLHFFYDGEYINTKLLTAELEDYSQPRPMTALEREAFLADAFSASGW